MVQQTYGNNRVFCEGRFIAGPDARSCITSVLLIVVPSVFWQVEVGYFLAFRYNVLCPLVAGALQLASLWLLLATAFSDPGILPRQKDFSEHYDARTNAFRVKQPPRFNDVVLRGRPFRLKYCTTCNIYRPPRCSHCAVCENCVERFDHHCPWIGNCIGRRNYRLFYSFVSMTAVLNALLLGTSAAQMTVRCLEIQDAQGTDVGSALMEAAREAPICAALVVYCVALVWFTAGLCLYHGYLICTNQTTYEHLKDLYGKGNPFDRGVSGNCTDALCRRVRPRYFDASTGRILWPKATSHSARELKLSMGPSECKAAAPSASLGASSRVLPGVYYFLQLCAGMSVNAHAMKDFSSAAGPPAMMPGS